MGPVVNIRFESKVGILIYFMCNLCTHICNATLTPEGQKRPLCWLNSSSITNWNSGLAVFIGLSPQSYCSSWFLAASDVSEAHPCDCWCFQYLAELILVIVEAFAIWESTSMWLAKLLGIGKFGRAELQLFTCLKEVTWIELFCKCWERDLTELAQFSEDSAGCTLLRLSFVPVAEQRALCLVVVVFTILFTCLL